MNILDSILLAFESLSSNKFRSFLSILGVTIGVAAVLSGAILGVGNRESIMGKLAEAGADISFFYNKPQGMTEFNIDNLSYRPELSITSEDIQYIKENCDAVEAISPFLLLPAPLRYGERYHTIKAVGLMLPQSAREVFRIKTESGRFLTELDVRSKAKVCVIERTDIAEEIFGGQIPVGQYISIGGDRYKIVGTIKKLIFPFGYPLRLIAIFPATSLQETSGIRKYSSVEMKIKSIQDVAKAKDQLRQVLARRFGYPSDYYISEYSHYVQTALDVVNLVSLLIIGIAVISLTVGGVGIMNVMMTMVVEQTREIGIAKAIGAKKHVILMLFLAESTILSLLGGAVGIILGLGASKLVTHLAGIPFIVPAWAILLGFLLSVVVGIISGYYPAKRGAELDPVEALRQV